MPVSTKSVYSVSVRSEMAVSVDPTDTVLDSFLMGEERTGVVWQVKNEDGSQTLSCWPETRESENSDWVPHDYTDQLVAVGPGETKRATWKFMAYEVRLVGTASGAGLNAVVWRRELIGVPP